MARPKGSKSKTHSGYKRRTQEVKERFGKDIYRQWGKLGGNPILLKPRVEVMQCKQGQATALTYVTSCKNDIHTTQRQKKSDIGFAPKQTKLSQKSSLEVLR